MTDSKDSAESASQKVFLPEPTNVKFLGHDIGMKPVPVSLAKDIRRLSENVESALVSLGTDSSQNKLLETDVLTSDLYLDVVHKLLGFYGVSMTKTALEDKITIPQLKQFIKMQAEIQGEEDFLFGQLNRIMRIYSPRPRENSEGS